MTEAEKPKTMEEILVEVAFLKAKARGASGRATSLPDGTKVRLSDAAMEKLAKSKDAARQRNSDLIGEVVGFDDRQGRILVKWLEPIEHIEPLAAKFLEVVS